MVLDLRINNANRDNVSTSNMCLQTSWFARGVVMSEKTIVTIIISWFFPWIYCILPHVTNTKI